MHHTTTACCFGLVLAVAHLAAAEEPKPEAAKETIRFVLRPNESEDRLLALPAKENQKPPKHGAVVTCSGMRFEKSAIVFLNATLETEGERVTATEVTVKLDDVSDAAVSWGLSDDFKITLKTAEASQRFLK